MEAVDPNRLKIPDKSTQDEMLSHSGVRNLLRWLSPATRRVLTEWVWTYFTRFHSPAGALFFSNRKSGLSLSWLSYLRRIEGSKEAFFFLLLLPQSFLLSWLLCASPGWALKPCLKRSTRNNSQVLSFIKINTFWIWLHCYQDIP